MATPLKNDTDEMSSLSTMLAEAQVSDKALLHSSADAYIKAKEWGKACLVYERIMTLDPRDGNALAGLLKATRALTRSDPRGRITDIYRKK